MYHNYGPPWEQEYQACVYDVGSWSQDGNWVQPEEPPSWSRGNQEEPNWGYYNQESQSNWSGGYQPTWSSGYQGEPNWGNQGQSNWSGGYQQNRTNEDQSKPADPYIPSHHWGYQGDLFSPPHNQQWDQGPSNQGHDIPGPRDAYHPDQWPGYHHQGPDSSPPHPEFSDHIEDVLGQVVYEMQDTQRERTRALGTIASQMYRMAATLSKMREESRAEKAEDDESTQRNGQAMEEPVDSECLHPDELYLEEEPLAEHIAEPDLEESIEEEAAGWCEALRMQQMNDDEISSAIMKFCEQPHSDWSSRSAQLIKLGTLPDPEDLNPMDPNPLPSVPTAPQKEPEDEESWKGVEEVLAHTDIGIKEEAIKEPTEEVDDSDEEPPKDAAATHPVLHQNVCRLLGKFIKGSLNVLTEDFPPPKYPAPEIFDIPVRSKRAAGRRIKKKPERWPKLIKSKDPSDHHLRPMEKRKIKGTYRNHKKKPHASL